MKYLYWCALVLCGLIGQNQSAKAGTVCPLTVAGDFPVTYIDGRLPVIKIEIGKKQFRMVVDSGAAFSMIGTASWEALGGPHFIRINGSYATGIGGNAQLNAAVLEDVTTPESLTRDQAFIVADNNFLLAPGKAVVQGVLGYDFLNNFDIGLDFPDNRLTLYFRQRCDTAQAPWAGDYDLEALTVNPRTLETTTPYGVDEQTFQAIFDTGAEFSLVSQSSLTREGLKPLMTQTGSGHRARGFGPHIVIFHNEMFASITVGAESFSNAWLTVDNTPASKLNDGVIGEDYLQTHRVFISNSSDTVLFGLYTARKQ